MPETLQRIPRPVGRPPKKKPLLLVKELRRDGWSIRRIARAMGLSYGTVRRITKTSHRELGPQTGLATR